MRGGTCANILEKLLDNPTLFLLVLMIGQQSQSVTRVIYGRTLTWDDADDKKMKTFNMENLGTKWRERRGRIWKKAGCDAFQGVDHNLSLRPQRLDERDWDMYYRYMLKTEPLLACARNKANRANQNIYHTKGSRPFNVEHEVWKKRRGGKLVELNSLLDAMRKNPDGLLTLPQKRLLILLEASRLILPLTRGQAKMMLCRGRIEHAIRRKNQDEYVILDLG
ncbi:hypothetical protein LINPERHAP2_LOCUS19113 [Linum perenne]